MRTRYGALLAFMLFACERESPRPDTREAPPAPAVSAKLAGFGECRLNHCTVHFAQSVTGDGTSLSLSRCASPSPTCGTPAGQLTPEGFEQVREIAGQLAAETLAERYGCPGCADGPVTTLALHHADGRVTEHSFDPSRLEQLPLSLRRAAALVNEASEALAHCTRTPHFEPSSSCAAELAKGAGQAAAIP